MFLEAVLSHSRKLFSEFLYKIFVTVLHDIIGLKICHLLSVNHNPELRCVICTGVTLFEPVLHLNCTALSQSESSNFFSCVLLITVMLFICSKNNGGGLEELGDFLRAGDDSLARRFIEN